MDKNYFEILQAVNVNGHVEKKGKFTYLSWPFAYAELFKLHPRAKVEVREWDGVPVVKGPKGWMVCVTVSVPFENDWISRTQWHPVLDGANKAIVEPDVFQINTSIQRAAVKAIALHGLGLYIYAGEDLPIDEKEDQPNPNQAWIDAAAEVTNAQEYAAKRAEMVKAFGSEKKVPREVGLAFGQARMKVAA